MLVCRERRKARHGMAQRQGTSRDFRMTLPADPAQVPMGELEELPLDEEMLSNEQALMAFVWPYIQTLIAVGGVVQFAARRREYAPATDEGPAMVATTGVIGRWDSYGGPMERIPQEAEQQPEPVAEAA